MDTEDGRAARPPSGMDSDHDEMCWKSIMAIAPPVAAMASGSGDVAARPLPPGGESPNLASPFAHWWPSSELHVSLLAKVARFFNGFHRFPEAEEMELSKGEWDEISEDGEDASAEKIGAGTPAETVGRKMYSLRTIISSVLGLRDSVRTDDATGRQRYARAMSDTVDRLAPGDEVEVFYRLSEDAHRSLPVEDSFSALLRPRVGWSDSWVLARVLQAWPPPGVDETMLGAAPHVHVCHMHPLWTDRGGHMLDEEKLAASARAAEAASAITGGGDDLEARRLAVAANCDGYFRKCDVRRVRAPTPRPILSIVVVRWGGELTEFNEAQWGALSASTSDRYIDSFLRHVYGCLGPAYETLSVYIESGHDLGQLRIGSLASRLRGAHRASCFFLWPTLEQVAEPLTSPRLAPSTSTYDCPTGRPAPA